MSGSDPVAIGRRSVLAGAALVVPAAALGAAAAGAQAPPPSAPARRRVPAPSAADGGVSTILANHVANARFEQLDAGAIERAKLRLLDVVGCAIGAMRGENHRALAEVFAADGGGVASVLGTGRKASIADAAMANAILIRAFDFEVMTVRVRDVISPSHNAPTTVMTALALTEAARADGRAYLLAQALGDDFAARSIAASGIDFNDGWDGVPVHCTMAAAAVTANFRRLSPLQTRNAMGLAADGIGGTVQNVWDGAQSWKVVQGSCARTGILAVGLAQAGWTGMTDPMLSPCGLYGQFTSGCARPDLLTVALGKEWNGEIYFKPWPSCAANHPTIETALALRDRVKLDPATIDSVTIEVTPHVLELFIAKPLLPGPSPHSQANFNLRFACANALLRGGLRQEHYAPAAMADAALAALIARTTITPIAPGKEGVTLTVRRRDGTMVSESLAGRPKHYAGSTVQEVEAKFHQQVAFNGTVPEALANEIRQRVGAIERERDMASFVAMLARATRFPA